MTKNLPLLIILGVLFSLWTCQPEAQLQSEEPAEMKLPTRPNILWLVTEDLGPYLPMFGDSTIQTPNLSRLAAEGVVYPGLFSTSGVCAPSRAAIATGMYPSGIGANHMRTTSYTEVTGLPPYEAVPPAEVRMMSEILRMHGYYCTNNSKKDYQFTDPVTAWDESSNFAHWRNRNSDQPFFSIFNFTTSHESGLFEPYGFRHTEMRHYQAGDTTLKSAEWGQRMSEAETPVHVPKDLNFPIPPYLPDTELVRRDLWKMYNNIAETDRQLGAILDQLEADGLLEETIIFFYADHGGPLPRQKRLIYDSGLNSPMIIRFPNQQQAGTRDDQLVSFIDFAPTVFSLTGVEPPEYLQGQAFLGDFEATESRGYIHAAADRFDGFTDAIRAVRDGQFKYIRNYRPQQGYYLPVEYRERIPIMQELLRLRDQGMLDEYQAQWFRQSKEKEELFDCVNDPHELHNLAKDPEYKDKLSELQAEMDRWLMAIGDQPNLPEAELLSQLWQGSDQKPSTLSPETSLEDGNLVITCGTNGASIGYKIITADGKEPTGWSVYSSPLEVIDATQVLVQAHRIGYTPSEVVTHNIN